MSERDWQKIRNDLHLIELLNSLAREKGYRLIVSGGYATDGNLGRITRTHDDIDIQIFGKDGDSECIVNELMAEVRAREPAYSEMEVKDKGRQEYYHTFFAEGNGLGADIDYIQVTGNPFDQIKCVVRKDGSYTEKQEYDTVDVELEGIHFEAINPTSGLVDLLYKRNIRGDVPKMRHDQDMENLRLITDPRIVDARLAAMKK